MFHVLILGVSGMNEYLFHKLIKYLFNKSMLMTKMKNYVLVKHCQFQSLVLSCQHVTKAEDSNRNTAGYV